ncbi:phosphoglycolate phosphatase [Marinobacterium halophilum]|uniref:Phosphoglycolate phosphatase n=1 Tax=Marinobacterium halophilum TaxID=267374 RepID=A0A2P8EKJ4_9GAMM|nr:HAD-IA family hydrolase [Marinobacterium halophilum]PSL10005.1 phosphoglycolate phosphatase [Marinobacterium halophilum]
MYKLLIFDWDGTIIDSTQRIASCIRSSAHDLGLPVPSWEASKDIIGLGLPEAIKVLFPTEGDAIIEPLSKRYSHYYTVADETPIALFPGVQHTLESLKAKGYRLAVATGKSRAGLEHVLAETGLGWLFETSRCADETTSKPDPHMLHELLHETGVGPGHALMIGDTEYDLEMGRRAGMDTLAVSYGAHHLDRLRVLNPVKEIHHFTELEVWLDDLSASNT